MTSQEDPPITVFVSHKHDATGPAAQSISLKISQLFAGTKCFVAQDIRHGKDWSKDIHDALESSSWLLLLYTDPSQIWDWCLDETGFFAGRVEKADRLVCIVPEQMEAPGPLKRWKTCKATAVEIKALLRSVFGERFPRVFEEIDADPAVVRDSYIDDLVRQFLSCFSAQTAHYHARQWRFSVPNGGREKLRVGCLPDDTKVFARKEALEPLGYDFPDSGEIELSWEAVRENLDSIPFHSSVLETAIAYSMHHVLVNSMASKTLPVVRVSRKNKACHPTLYSSKFVSGCDEFCFILADVPETTPVPGLGDLALASNLLRSSISFRTKLINEHLTSIGPHLNKPSVKGFRDLLTRIHADYCTVSLEAMSMGLYDTEVIRHVFVSEDDIEFVGFVLGNKASESGEWVRLSVELFADLGRNLEEDALKPAFERVSDILGAMATINGEFIRRASLRISTLALGLDEKAVPAADNLRHFPRVTELAAGGE